MDSVSRYDRNLARVVPSILRVLSTLANVASVTPKRPDASLSVNSSWHLHDFKTIAKFMVPIIAQDSYESERIILTRKYQFGILHSALRKCF